MHSNMYFHRKQKSIYRQSFMHTYTFFKKKEKEKENKKFTFK